MPSAAPVIGAAGAARAVERALAGRGERGGPGMVEVERDGERLALEMTPVWRAKPDGGKSWQLGFGNAAATLPAHDAVLRLNPIAAVPAAVRETGYQARQLFEMATAVPARIARIDDKVGSLKPGLAADLFLLRGDVSKPFDALAAARRRQQASRALDCRPRPGLPSRP